MVSFEVQSNYLKDARLLSGESAQNFHKRERKLNIAGGNAWSTQQQMYSQTISLT